MAQEELQESKLTKAGGRKPTHGCNYPMVGWPSVILTPMGPSLNLTREGTSRPSLRSSLSLNPQLNLQYTSPQCNSLHGPHFLRMKTKPYSLVCNSSARANARAHKPDRYTGETPKQNARSDTESATHWPPANHRPVPKPHSNQQCSDHNASIDACNTVITT